MTGHTPGPWQAIAWSGHAPTMVIAGELRDIDTVVVAECSGHGRYVHESIGDARLIAAAPDLLSAAEDALRLLIADGYYPEGPLEPDIVCKTLDEAINKAKGMG